MSLTSDENTCCYNIAKMYFDYSLKTEQNIVLIREYFCSPLVNFGDISYLLENLKLRQIRDVFTLCAGVLVTDSLLHTLPYQFLKNKIESLSYRKKALNCLSI